MNVLTNEESVISGRSICMLFRTGILGLYFVVKRNGLLCAERITINTCQSNIACKATCTTVIGVGIATDGKPHVAFTCLFIRTVHVEFLRQCSIHIDVHHTLGRVVYSHDVIVLATFRYDSRSYNLGLSTHVSFKRNLVVLTAVADKNLATAAFVSRKGYCLISTNVYDITDGADEDFPCKTIFQRISESLVFFVIYPVITLRKESPNITIKACCVHAILEALLHLWPSNGLHLVLHGGYVLGRSVRLEYHVQQVGLWNLRPRSRRNHCSGHQRQKSSFHVLN